MRKLLALSVILASPALAQQPNGTINAPIYATGYISQVGGTNITTKIAAQPNHPTNLNIYTTSAITGVWTIQLPNPAFEGQVLSFNCGATVNTISIISTDGSSIDSNLPTTCVGASTFSTQFDQRANIWRNIGYSSSAGILPTQLPAFTGGDISSSAGSVVLSAAPLLSKANTWTAAQTFGSILGTSVYSLNILSDVSQPIIIGNGSGQYQFGTDSKFRPLSPYNFDLGGSSYRWSTGFLGTLDVAPPSGSTGRGMNIDISGPTSGSHVGAIYSNLIQGTFNAPISGTTTPGTGDCQCWSLVQISASTGSNFDGVEAYGLSVGNVVNANTTTYSDIVGISMGVYTNYSTNSRLYGGTAAATSGVSGKTPFLLGFEIGVAQNNATESDVPYRAGINIDNYGTHHASVVDTAISIMGGNPGGQWKHMISLVTVGGTITNALDTSGDMFWSESSATIAHVFNMPNVTVTGNILYFPGVVLGGDGNFVLSTTRLYGDPMGQTTSAGQITYGGVTAAAANCGSLAGSAGCVKMNIEGTARYVPYY